MSTDGLEEYKLGANYGEHKAGSTIRVDPERRNWLNENGYNPTAPPQPPEIRPVPTTKSTRKMVSFDRSTEV
jgi:hypothetical protein